MLLVRWVVDSDWDQDEEDEKGPDDFNEQLDLQKQETKRTWQLIKQDLDRQDAKTEGKRRTTNTILGVFRSSGGNLADTSGVGRVCRQLPGVKSNPAVRLGEWCGLITADRSRQKECFCGGLEEFAHLLHAAPLRLNRLCLGLNPRGRHAARG